MRYVEMTDGTVVYEDGTTIMPNGDVGQQLNFSAEQFECLTNDLDCQSTQ